MAGDSEVLAKHAPEPNREVKVCGSKDLVRLHGTSTKRI